MAGRYVVLEFDDRDAAQSFVMNESMADHLGFRINSMFLKPHKYCECPDLKRKQNQNWRKHSKYGLFVCIRCGKPSRFHLGGVAKRLQYAFGFNLLGPKV